MKIIGAETFPVANPTPNVGGPVWLFVRLDTDSGVSGYGEVFTSPLYGHPLTVAALVDEVIDDLIVGMDAGNIELIYHKVHNLHYSHTGDLMKAAILAGIDMACWDIVGKQANMPIYGLLGGRVRDRVRMYSHIYAPPGQGSKDSGFWRDPQRIAAGAMELVDQGFTGVKLDPFPLLAGADSHSGQLIPAQLSLDVLDHGEEIIRAIRKAVGSRCDIILGTHGQMTASAAIRVARRLEPYDLLWFEEPVLPELPGEMAKVAKATSIPIAAGERLTSKWEFAQLIRHDAASILNLDVSLVGLLEAKKITSLAEANYLQITPHCYGGPLVAAASAHLSLTAPNLLIMEGNGRYDGVYADILDVPVEWREGYVIPSMRPGLGHNLNEEMARDLVVKSSDRFPYMHPVTNS